VETLASSEHSCIAVNVCVVGTDAATSADSWRRGRRRSKAASPSTPASWPPSRRLCRRLGALPSSCINVIVSSSDRIDGDRFVFAGDVALAAQQHRTPPPGCADGVGQCIFLGGPFGRVPGPLANLFAESAVFRIRRR
jgi:hypothetical protein